MPNFAFTFLGPTMNPICKLVDAQTTTLSLESQISQLALEANYLSNLSQGLKKILPSLVQKVKESLGMVSSTAPSDTVNGSSNFNLMSKQKEALQKMKALDFLVFAEVLVQVPENFKGNLHDYVVLLNNLSPKVYQEVNNLLGEYNVILSSFINNREVQTGLKTHEALFRRIQGARSEREKMMRKFFPKVDGKSRQPLKTIMHRGAELETVFKEVNKLKGTHQKQNLVQLQSMVQQSTDMLGIILKNIQDNPSTVVGPEATLDVAQGAYEVAKEIEHVAAFHYQVMTVLQTADLLVEVVMTA